MTHMFRAIWPILDTDRDRFALIAEAGPDVARLAAQAHAELTGDAHWHIESAAAVPGSGCVSSHVLVCDIPAKPMRFRSYWKATA